MKLYPQDLGDRLNQEMQHQRVLNYQGGPDAVKPKSLLGWIIGGIALTGLGWALHIMAFAVLPGIATVYLLGWYAYSALRARDADEGLPGLVTAYELKCVRQTEADPLVQQFLTLANAVIALPTTDDATAEREVRDAISALGMALESLPPTQKIETENPASLHAEAEAQAAEASAETDAVIAASLRRRVDSLTRRAETAARTLLLLRRNQALREEVSEQIQALQTSLTALQVGGRQSVPELAGLAASIQRVAQEANAMTAARAEVGIMAAEPLTRLTLPPAEETGAINRR